MSENTNNRLYLMITITNRVMGATHFLDFYRAFGAPVVFTALGRGTASNDILNTLGLEATEKSVMFSVVTPAVKDVLMRELVDTMRIDRPGSGIAVCLHLSSVGGRTALNYLISGKSDAQPDMSVKEEELMNDSPYQLIVAITNTGYTDTVYVRFYRLRKSLSVGQGYRWIPVRKSMPHSSCPQFHPWFRCGQWHFR